LAKSHHERGNDREALDVLLLLLGMTSDWRHAAGIWTTSWSQSVELGVLRTWRNILASNSLTDIELASISQSLQQIYDVRLPLATCVQVHGAVFRSAVLQSEEELMNFHDFERDPSWRYLFRARFVRADAIVQARQTFLQLEALFKQPLQQRIVLFDEYCRRGDSELMRIPLAEIHNAFKQEIAAQRAWSLALVSMKICQFVAARSALPKTLHELTPEYLQESPRCPHGGEEFEYTSGRIWCANDAESYWEFSCRK
jgi:hypothetical protein